MWLCVKKDNGITYAVKMINKTYILKGHTVKRILREREITEVFGSRPSVFLLYSRRSITALWSSYVFLFRMKNFSILCLTITLTATCSVSLKSSNTTRWPKSKPSFIYPFVLSFFKVPSWVNAAEIVLALEYLHSNNIVYRYSTMFEDKL